MTTRRDRQADAYSEHSNPEPQKHLPLAIARGADRQDALRAVARALGISAAREVALAATNNQQEPAIDPDSRTTPRTVVVPNQGPRHLDPQQLAPLPEPPLSVAEVAAWLGYDPVTVRRLIKQKKLAANKVSGQWRITRLAILKLLETDIDP